MKENICKIGTENLFLNEIILTLLQQKSLSYIKVKFIDLIGFKLKF